MANLSVTFWGDVLAIDKWLDADVAQQYKQQPLAQHWGRTAKVIEELGEAISELISLTGQNPRKGPPDQAAYERLMDEIADVAWTAIFCLQHFTKNTVDTEDILARRLARIRSRIPQ
jgi:NTP pyrophosphatase (non-canonical NTP hydrolase)